MISKKLIYHVGISGFPHGKATIQRILSICKAIEIGSEYHSIVLSKIGVYSKVDTFKFKIKKKGFFEGIEYCYTGFKNYRSNNYLIRNLEKIFGFINEALLIFRHKKEFVCLILYTPYFFELLYYKFLCIILRKKLIVQYVEFRSAIKDRFQFWTSINDKLFDRYVALLSDGVITISSYLENHLMLNNENLKILKIPSVTDYDVFEKKVPKVIEKPFFLYCASAEYYEVFIFIIESFEKVKNKVNEISLVLIISGGNLSMERVIERIKASNHKDSIILKSNITFTELVDSYSNATGLLIPLNNSIQDIARFPHKISEYCASKRPIVSTNIGEVKLYFKDSENAYLANNYNIDEYVEKMIELFSDLSKAKEIGINGYNTGLSNFSYKAYEIPLSNFLFKVLNTDENIN